MSKEGTALLRRMIDEVIPDAQHWTKGTLETTKYWGTRREHPAYCLVGAAQKADGGDVGYWNKGTPVFEEAVARLAKAITGESGSGPGHLFVVENFNDKTNTRYADVREVVEKAIKTRAPR